ncbi:hypothetical protein JYU12_02445 [bacterium AH-315-K03]|nr:hypothetical protein [bacterium AH-315-K03]
MAKSEKDELQGLAIFLAIECSVIFNDWLCRIRKIRMKLTRYLMVLLFILPYTANAELEKSKDWYWDLSLSKNNYVYAMTNNESGEALGQYCYPFEDKCVYIVSLGITCNAGAEYPSIVNSSEGVAEVTLVCGHVHESGNVFYVEPFDEVDNLIRNAGKIGFVVAMRDDSFKIVHFSLLGSSHAIKKIREKKEN